MCSDWPVSKRASPGDRIVRHQHSKYPVTDLLSQDLFEVYQAYQRKPVFHEASQILTFYGLDGTRACFFGIFQNRGRSNSTARPALTKSPWEAEWRSRSKFFYQLEHLKGFAHLENRIVMEWGRGALAWCQRLVNKPVIEITAPGRRLPPFRDYLEFDLSYDELRELYRHEDAHREWCSRLSAVAGVYLILAETTGQLYVGSATGAEGLWERWRDYAKTGHGNNDLLKGLLAADVAYPKAFRFSILQIVPKSMTRENVIEHEARFKAKLGCLAHGLNLN